MKASAELKLMGTITAQLGQRIEVGDGPKGSRLLVDVTSVEVEVERIRASLTANDAADWLTMAADGSVGRWTCVSHLRQTTAPSFTSSTVAGQIWKIASLRRHRHSKRVTSAINGSTTFYRWAQVRWVKTEY